MKQTLCFFSEWDIIGTFSQCLELPSSKCPVGHYNSIGSLTEFPTTDVVLSGEDDGFKPGSQVENYVETWSDNGYTVRAKANVAQRFGVNAELFVGMNLDTGLAPYFDTFEVFNSGGAFSNANFKFQGDAGVTSFIDMGGVITPKSMTLAARITANAVNNAPGRFKVYGSNIALDWNRTNSSTWILLFAQITTTTYPSRFRTFEISTDTAYQYYALHITHTMGGSSCFFSEWDIVGTVSKCLACPAGLIASEASTGLADCKLPCPAGQFSSNTASNVASMCGASQNEACPAQLSSVHESYVASNGNDGNIDSMVHSSGSTAPIAHVFNIDFEQMRNIESVRFFNRPVLVERITGAEIRIGSSLSWEDNKICATLNSDLIQTYNCNLVGRYIFIIVSAARAQANFPLNFMELQAFSACTSCPATAISLPGSTSSAACGCPAGSFEETRALNPPYASRSYSSLLGDHHSASLLDDAEHIQILTYYSISIQTNVSL